MSLGLGKNENMYRRRSAPDLWKFVIEQCGPRNPCGDLTKCQRYGLREIRRRKPGGLRSSLENVHRPINKILMTTEVPSFSLISIRALGIHSGWRWSTAMHQTRGGYYKRRQWKNRKPESTLFERPAFAMGFGAWTLLVGQRARKEKRFRDDGRPRGSFATTRLQHLMNLKRFEANNYSHAKQSIFRVGRDRNIGSWRIKGTPDIRDEMSCNVNGKGWV